MTELNEKKIKALRLSNTEKAEARNSISRKQNTD